MAIPHTFRTATLVITACVVLGGTVAAVGPVALAPTDGADGGNSSTGGAATVADPSVANAGSNATGAAATQQSAAARSDRIDFLRVRAVDDGEYAYRFRVDGYVQRTRVDDRVKSEANDGLRRNGDGTVTVTGTTGNGLSDAYLIVGEIVSFRQIEGESDGELTLNGLELTVEELLATETLEVVARDEGAVRYQFTTDGPVEKIETEDDVAGDVDDRITRNDDGTVTVRGVTDDGNGDAFRIRGEVRSFRKTGGESRFRLRLDGLDVDPDTLAPGAGSFPSGGGTDAKRIGECTRIDEPGQYVLTRDLRNVDEDVCLDVRASGVTVDGDGHRIDGVDANDSVGLRIAAPEDGTVSNVTVRNVELTDWDAGLRATARSGGALDRVTVEGVTSASNRGIGVQFADVDAARVVDTAARDNGATGVLLAEPGPNSAVLDSRAEGNDGYGIVVFDAPDGTVVRDSRATDNEAGGIATANGDEDTVIRNNTATANGGDGISLSDSSAPTVRDNVVRGNADAGLSGFDVRDGTFAGNELVGNDEAGVALRYVDDTAVRGNDVRRNGGNGIALERSDRNTVVRNVVCANGASPPISVDADSTDNEIRDNRQRC
jgi:parallel beta-helix repeat protein